MKTITNINVYRISKLLDSETSINNKAKAYILKEISLMAETRQFSSLRKLKEYYYDCLYTFSNRESFKGSSKS